MKRFIEGEDRNQTSLLPNTLEDYIAEDNPVRIVEVFVDELDLESLGFQGVIPQTTGRPAYHPSVLLKLYIYGYVNRIQSSRRLERETQRNLELIWLTGKLTPDYKTIADFRKNNSKAIVKVCREFIKVCHRLKLLTRGEVAVDGSKFKAVNSGDKNFTPVRIKRRKTGIEKHIERYLRQLDEADKYAVSVPDGKTQRIKEKLSNLKKEMKRLKKIEKALEVSSEKQISLTDPDARVMATTRKNSGVVGYNVQAAVDTKNHLIVAHEVTNQVSDRQQLTTMAEQARKAMAKKKLTVLADRGYFSGEELLKCDKAGIKAFVPKTYTSAIASEGRFTKDAFHYEGRHNQYRCPAGERLIYRGTNLNKNMMMHSYWSSNCPNCEIRSKCTTSKYRKIQRWIHADVVEKVEKALEKAPKKMSIRRQTVEHTFGTLKSWMGSTHFLTKRLDNVSAEMSLNVLAYNIKRTMSLIGVKPLIRAITTEI